MTARVHPNKKLFKFTCKVCNTEHESAKDGAIFCKSPECQKEKKRLEKVVARRSASANNVENRG